VQKGCTFVIYHFLELQKEWGCEKVSSYTKSSATTEKGVSHTAINKRNKSILKKIKTFFEKEGFHFG